MTDDRCKVMGKAHLSLRPWGTKPFLRTIKWTFLPHLNTISPVVSVKVYGRQGGTDIKWW